MSLSMRRAWIESVGVVPKSKASNVALHAESVDRKILQESLLKEPQVALHAESVDRNFYDSAEGVIAAVGRSPCGERG